MCAESKSPLSAALDRSAALPSGSEDVAAPLQRARNRRAVPALRGTRQDGERARELPTDLRAQPQSRRGCPSGTHHREHTRFQKRRISSCVKHGRRVRTVFQRVGIVGGNAGDGFDSLPLQFPERFFQAFSAVRQTFEHSIIYAFFARFNQFFSKTRKIADKRRRAARL